MDKAVFLTDMTWPDVKTRLPKVRLAILPYRLHGTAWTHLTFETDIASPRSSHAGWRLHTTRVSLCPPLRWGCRTSHEFPGRSPEIRYVHGSVWKIDTVLALSEHGIRRFSS